MHADLKTKGTSLEKLQKDVESLEYITVLIKINPSCLEELKIQESILISWWRTSVSALNQLRKMEY